MKLHIFGILEAILKKNLQTKGETVSQKKQYLPEICILIIIQLYKIFVLMKDQEKWRGWKYNIFHSHNILVPFLLAPRDIRKEISIGLLISFLLKSSDVPCSIGSWLKFLVGFASVSCKVDCDAAYNKAHNNFYHFFSGSHYRWNPWLQTQK